MSTRIATYALALILGSTPALAANPDSVVIPGDLRITGADSGIVFPDGSIQTTATLQGPEGPAGPQGPQGPPGVCSVVGDSIQVNNTFFGVGATADLATLNLSLTGGKRLIVTATISPLTWPPAPADYGGKNHTLHVNVRWDVIAGGYTISSFRQTAEQNFIQVQGVGAPTLAGTRAVTLRAVNSSYWSLDDYPYGTTPVGSNNFDVVFSAMEL